MDGICLMLVRSCSYFAQEMRNMLRLRLSCRHQLQLSHMVWAPEGSTWCHLVASVHHIWYLVETSDALVATMSYSCQWGSYVTYLNCTAMKLPTMVSRNAMMQYNLPNTSKSIWVQLSYLGWALTEYTCSLQCIG